MACSEHRHQGHGDLAFNRGIAPVERRFCVAADDNVNCRSGNHHADAKPALKTALKMGVAFLMMRHPLRLDDSITRQRVRPGTVRRVLPYAKHNRWLLGLLLLVTAIDAGTTVANPLLLSVIIDEGIEARRLGVVIGLALVIAGLALLDAAVSFLQAWSSARIGQGLVLNLRSQVFTHVQRQPLAFFTRAQTGSLVSRLNTDVVGAQQAITTLLSQTLSMILTLGGVLAAMFFLSWQISLATLVVFPLFVLPTKLIARRVQRLTRQLMQLDAEVGSLMNERFNVAGAMLAKLYGRPEEEASLFTNRATRVRDIAVMTNLYGRVLPVMVGLLAGLTTAIIYGLGGSLAINGSLKIGSLVAMAVLITRLYGPINQLTNIQVNFQTALVSFDRVFEVLDLEPIITEPSGATALAVAGNGNGSAPTIEFADVSFRYPAASEISLASLESIALPARESTEKVWVLRDVSFVAPAGKLTALVGPSGAGKTTITHLVPRLYDPGSGAVRIGGQDIRQVTLQSLMSTVGVVPQEAHLFHDTIRANLLYARPGATEQDLREACEAARIWDLLHSLPDGLDTVAGDRGYRFSGGEKQRLALARLLLKAPPVVVLDEATAHLDSESEAAIQQALKTALSGRTSLVIAHRLSTIREADQILVIDAGEVRERGTHDELLAAGGLYAELYRTQFAGRPARSASGNGGQPTKAGRKTARGM
jgi:ATP-binding cassette, subfamily B, bacterial